tara:strand:- start:57 stop:878 length:822 start_codon:yes stop_codon:yes gene_type:complete
MLKEQIRNIQTEASNLMLHSVQINPTELCNRKCSFCPRHDAEVYPNANKHVDDYTIKKLCTDLKNIGFNNRVGFAGFGEPLLHRDIFSCIKIVRDILPDLKYLEIVTNGDKLSREVIEKLYNAGCNLICISMYDEDKSQYFTDIKGNIPIDLIFSHNYKQEENYGLNIVNRSDIIKRAGSYFKKPCYIPFYKLFVDWNGDILLCENDWTKSKNFGNINKLEINDIWFSDHFNEVRKGLLTDRKEFPCNNCNVCGTKRGINSVDIFKKSIQSVQ